MHCFSSNKVIIWLERSILKDLTKKIALHCLVMISPFTLSSVSLIPPLLSSQVGLRQTIKVHGESTVQHLNSVFVPSLIGIDKRRN